MVWIGLSETNIRSAMQSILKELVCVHENEVEMYGCPHCSSRLIENSYTSGSVVIYRCLNCKNNFATLPNGVDRASMSITEGSKAVFPIAQPHPFIGRTRTILKAR